LSRPGLEQLKSVVVLDLADNRVAELNEVNRLGTLPLLERLSLRGNPMATSGRTYRVHTLAQFRDRAAEVRRAWFRRCCAGSATGSVTGRLNPRCCQRARSCWTASFPPHAIWCAEWSSWNS